MKKTSSIFSLLYFMFLTTGIFAQTLCENNLSRIIHAKRSTLSEYLMNSRR